MPKMKTNKAVRKRFKLTKKGKLLGGKSGRRHLNVDKSAKQKRQKRGWREIDPADAKRIKVMLPYG